MTDATKTVKQQTVADPYLVRRGEPKRSARDKFLGAMRIRGVVWDECTSAYAYSHHDTDSRYLWRVIGDEVQVSVKKHFDRWANSIDFVFTVPKTRRAFEKVMRRLESAYEAGEYSMKMGRETRL